MENTINQRLKELIKFLIDNKKVYNQKDFGDKIGKSKTQLSEMLKGTLVISERTVHAIVSAFPELNTEWLLTGEGEMLKKEKKSFPKKEEEMVTMSREVFEQIARLTETVLSQQRTIEELVAKRGSAAHMDNVHSANVG